MTDGKNYSSPAETTGVLADYISSAGHEPLPDDVTLKASYHLLDTVAAMISGSDLSPGQAGIAFTQSQGGTDESSVIGSNFCTNATLAALANGISAHADETDDSHAPSFSHPGCAVVPAAIAVAEKNRRSGADLVRSIALGYDIGCRVTPALGMDQYSLAKNSKSSHAIVSVFGAAAAAATLERLSPIECEYVLSYAAQQASGISSLIRDKDHIEKAFVIAGMGARNGVASAMMVSSGFTGVRQVFTGSINALDSLSSSDNRIDLADGLGQRFEIIRTNIKKYAVGSPVQAAIQATEDLIDREEIDPVLIEHIDIRLPSDLIGIVDARDMPNVNCQYLVAGTIIDGKFTFEMAHDESRFHDPAIRALMGRINLHPDENMRGLRQSKVTVCSEGGRVFESHVSAVRGTAENPMSEEELTAKSLDLIAPVLGQKNSVRLIETLINATDVVKDVRDLRIFWCR